MFIDFIISIISFYSCILVANFLANKHLSRILDFQGKRFQNLDGLRGFLAIAVFFHHYAITFDWKIKGYWTTPENICYQNYGKVGVAFFFILSGFLFTNKILNSKVKINWLRFYEGRIFRIFPLYIFTLFFITGIVFFNSDFKLISNSSEILKEYTKWLLLLGCPINQYSDTRLIISYVDWTLKYEWIYYFILPILYILIQNLSHYIIYVFFAICSILFIYPIDLYYFSSEYFLLFSIGGVVSNLINTRYFNHKIIKSWYISITNTFCIIFIIFYPNTLDSIHITFISISFIFIALGNNIFGILIKKPCILLGHISFSIYLLHGLFLYFIFTQFNLINLTEISKLNYYLFMPALSISLILLCTITYCNIEKPFLALGKKYLLTNTASRFSIKH